MRAIPSAAVAQFGVFTAGQAVGSGWTSHALRHAVAQGYLERLRPGTYAAPLPDALTYEAALARLRRNAAAVSLTNPGAPVSHLAAGALLGLDILEATDRVCVTFPRGRRGTMADVHRHRGRFVRSDIGRLGALLLTTPARTVLDIGHEHGADAGIVSADSALRLGLTTAAALIGIAERTANWPGIAGAHHAIALADPRAESALESVSRLRILDAGLPAPQPQARIFELGGRFLGRTDFYWDEFGVVGEADGFGKLETRTLALRDQAVRQGLMEDAGLIFVRWGWRDLHRFDPVAARLEAAFARGLRTDRAPRLWRSVPTPWPQMRAAS